MHKKTFKYQLSSSVPGFLLTEFIVAFTVLSLALVFCAYAFLSTVKEYRGAKQRLRNIVSVQNNIEAGRAEDLASIAHLDASLNGQTRSVEQGIVLPVMPKLKQEWIEMKTSDDKNALSLRLRGRIKES